MIATKTKTAAAAAATRRVRMRMVMTRASPPSAAAAAACGTSARRCCCSATRNEPAAAAARRRRRPPPLGRTQPPPAWIAVQPPPPPHHQQHCNSRMQSMIRTMRQRNSGVPFWRAAAFSTSALPPPPAPNREASAAAAAATASSRASKDDDGAGAMAKPPFVCSSSSSSSSQGSSAASAAAQRRRLGPACALWLRRDPAWRRRVWELLELPPAAADGAAGSNSNPNGGGAAARLRDAASFYRDSIPSFAASLQQPSAVHTGNDDGGDDWKRALDAMAAAGLHRPRTLQQYRQHWQWKERRGALERLHRHRTQQWRHLQRARAAAHEELGAWRERRNELQRQLQQQQAAAAAAAAIQRKQQEQEQNEEGLLSRTLRSVQSLFALGGEATTAAATATDNDPKENNNLPATTAVVSTTVPSQKQQRRLREDMAERQQILERHDEKMDALQRSIGESVPIKVSPNDDIQQQQVEHWRRQLRNMVRAREALQDEIGRLQRQLQVSHPVVSTLSGSSSKSSSSTTNSQQESCGGGGGGGDGANRNTALSSAFRVPLNGTTKHDSAAAAAAAAIDGNNMDPQTLQEEIDRVQQKIDNRRATVERHQSTLDAVQVQLSQLNDELDPTRLPLAPAQVAAVEAAAAGARDAVCAAFGAHVRRRHAHLLAQYRQLDRTTDLTRPHEWFPRARLSRRRIVFHGGPTNSGKTYAALERLKEAPRGAYLGPLRLLAAEVYEGLTADGVYCNLYTGQERREIPFATHSSSTVEMASLTQDYDVLVVDEIQMLANSERGFAWTRALLGSRCPEIHVCGGLEAVDVVRRLAQACGDEFELHQYERFSELRVADRSLAQRPDQLGIFGQRGRIQPGDCVVAFSRDDIFAIKREIESKTPYKCCVIYGSLPPSTRSGEARRFNDPESGYDVLVASDAIGMGLNLNIRRIIFSSIYKNDSSGIVKLDHSAIKQIAGRAGRRNSPYPQGEVTTRDPRDLPYLHECMKTDIKPISKAGLLPTAIHIETFSNALEEYGLGHGPKNLHKALLQFNDMASVQSDYFVCRQADMVNIAQQLAELDLSIADKYLFCLCPVQSKNPRSSQVMQQFARKLASGEVAGLGHNLIPRKPASLDDLTNLCHLYNSLELFLWLQKKFPPGNVMEQRTALSRRDICVDMIGKGLASSEKLKISHCYVTRDKLLRRKIDGDSSARVDKKKIIDYDEYYSDEEDEQWDDGYVQRWI